MTTNNLQLQFSGRGSAFNVLEGNTSAFIKHESSLLLFDCGSSVFERLKREGVLEGIKEIVVVVTHTHDDHVGSLGALIAYAKFVMKAQIAVIHPNRSIVRTLRHLLVPDDWYNYVEVDHDGQSALDIEFDWGNISLIAVDTQHIHGADCFGYIVETEHETFYYSGDANIIPHEVLHMFISDDIDVIYQDACILDYDGNVHLSLRKLCEYIGEDMREFVYLMHIDEQFNIQSAYDLGFNVVEVYKKENDK